MKNTKTSLCDSPPSSLVSPPTTEEMMAMDDAEFFDYLEQESNFQSPSSSKPEEISVVQNDESIILEQFLEPNLGINEPHQKISTSDSSIPCYQVIPDPEISLTLESFSNFPTLSDLVEDFPSFLYPPIEGLTLNERLHMLDEEIYEYHPPKSPIFINLVPETTNECLPTDIKENIRYIGNSFNPDRRKDVCRAFVRQLNSSDFPFSKDQIEVIIRIKQHVSTLHQLPNQEGEGFFTQYREQELKLVSDIDLLLDLLACTDYQLVSQTLINRYAAALIYELEFWIERDPVISLVICGKIPFFVDPATYIINKLIEAFPECTEDKIDAAFFFKRKEVHIKLTQLFSNSKFPFTMSQKALIQDITEAVFTTNGDPDSRAEREFRKILGKLLHDLNNIDNGSRVGISNPKKVRKEFNRLVDELMSLGVEERKFLSEFEHYSLNSADLVDEVIKVLVFSFIPRYTSPLPKTPKSFEKMISDFFA